jgi:hypothetical protein
VLGGDVGQHDPENVCIDKNGILFAILKRAIEETSQKYIDIGDSIIREVHLPGAILEAINQELVCQQQAAAYEYRLAAEHDEAMRKRIETAGSRGHRKVIAETFDGWLVRWQGIKAAGQIAKLDNSMVIVVAAGDFGPPIILGEQWTRSGHQTSLCTWLTTALQAGRIRVHEVTGIHRQQPWDN